MYTRMYTCTVYKKKLNSVILADLLMCWWPVPPKLSSDKGTPVFDSFEHVVLFCHTGFFVGFFNSVSRKQTPLVYKSIY